MLSQRTVQLKQSIDAMLDAGVRKTIFYTTVAASLRDTQGEPRQIRRAKAFVYLLERVPQQVHPYELLGGSITGMWPVDNAVPDFDTQYQAAVGAVENFIAHKNDPADSSQISLRFEVQVARAAGGGRFALMARDHYNGNIDFGRLQQINARLKEAYADSSEVQPSDIVKITEDFFNYDYGDEVMHWVDELPWSAANHVNLNYGKALKLGLGRILATVEEKLATAEEADKQEFYQAVAISLRGAIDFIRRYARSYAEAAAQEGDPARRVELVRISAILDKVAHSPAEGFYEAMQLLWMIHLIQSFSMGAALSFARFDQYMYPYYKKDIQRARITRDEAYELLCCMWLKVNEPKMRTVQSMTLSGLTPDGREATNDLSALCLEVTRDLRLPYPNVAVRVGSSYTPDWLYDQVVETIKCGFGIPMLINDDVWIPKFVDLGYPLDLARDYYNMGCVEMMIQGKQTNWLSATGGYISYPAILNELIDDWCEGRYAFERYEDLMAVYLEKLGERVRYAEGIAKKQIRLIHENSCDPFASALIDDCVERGKDMFSGGTVCPAHIAINGYGLATAADSFAVLRKLVFTEKKCTIQDLREAMQRDFQGCEALTKAIDTCVDKFGNDVDETDEIAVGLLSFLLDEIYRLNDGTMEEKFVTSFFSYTRNVSIGEVTGATPNGRKRGTALSDALGPSQGYDVKGPTKMLNSILKLDTTRLTGAVATNLKVNPSLFRDKAGTQALTHLLQTYIERGGPQIQVNFVSLEDLKAAQENPAEHRNLVVRIAGYCEYFVNLDVNQQQEIINRTEHELG
ncbi:MAG: pyruvate formate lyase family protein [Candidatus Pelethousia sp.]|nr:pyruvate formate lyase family protein [Candidatus Pelethousia sp.]